MICSKLEEEILKSSEHTVQRTLCWNQANHSRILNTAGRIKARNHTLIQSSQKKEHLSQMRETWVKEPSSNSEQIIVRNRILTESKPEAQKTLIWSKSKEGTIESRRGNKNQ